MPSLAVARAANAAFAPSYLPVAVFVGGTSGIGQALAEAFARHTKGNAHIVIVGRNQAAAESIIASFPKPTADPAPSHEFVPVDAFLMKSIQQTTATLLARLPKINFLFLSQGFFRTQGRVETAEGIDERLQLHYYSRWKFIHDLVPLLRRAKDAGEDAKVMSVLAAGHGGKIDLDNLGMKKSYSLARAGLTSPTYTDLMMESYAEREPDISFVHAYPGFVRTPIFKFPTHWAFRPINPVLKTVFTYMPGMTEPNDCGEWLLYAMLQAGKGRVRVNNKGDDIGESSYFGSPQEKEAVWQHTTDEVERALKA